MPKHFSPTTKCTACNRGSVPTFHLCNMHDKHVTVQCRECTARYPAPSMAERQLVQLHPLYKRGTGPKPEAKQPTTRPPVGGKPKAPWTGNKSKEQQLQQEKAKLEKELAQARKQLQQQQPAPEQPQGKGDNKDEDDPRAQELEKKANQLEKAYQGLPKDCPHRTRMEAEVKQIREEIRASWPPERQSRRAALRLKQAQAATRKQKTALEQLAQAKEAAQAALAAADQAHKEGEAKLLEHEAAEKLALEEAERHPEGQGGGGQPKLQPQPAFDLEQFSKGLEKLAEMGNQQSKEAVALLQGQLAAGQQQKEAAAAAAALATEAAAKKTAEASATTVKDDDFDMEVDDESVVISLKRKPGEEDHDYEARKQKCKSRMLTLAQKGQNQTDEGKPNNT